MLNEETKKKLFALRLVTMASTWAEQQSDARMPTMDFDARFGLLVDAEHRARDNRRLAKLLKEAQLRLPSACMEDVEATSDRGLEKSQLAQLGSCKWIAEHQNVLVSGSTGVGKSYLACALGNMACRRGYRVLYRRMPRLLDELSLARADGTYAKRLGHLSRVDVLVVDDWGLGALSEAQRHVLLEGTCSPWPTWRAPTERDVSGAARTSRVRRPQTRGAAGPPRHAVRPRRSSRDTRAG
jgi:DNA replication protein DnaC